MTDVEKSRLIDRKRLMLEYGFTGSSADRMIARPDVQTVHLDGERKIYILRDDVERVIRESTASGNQVRRTG